jgi:hypothetical protein
MSKEIKLFMNEIINYNCDGLCIQESCSERYTHSTIQKINGVNVVLGFCKKHAKEFEDYIFKREDSQ